MTITVTPEPSFAPPRNVVDLSVPTGSIMTDVRVWRDDPNGRTDLRSQPSPGFTSRQVFDFECPYGVPVTYGWQVTYSDGNNTAVQFSDTYSGFPTGWTGDTGQASVVSGNLVLSTGSANWTINRAISSTVWSEIRIGRLACSRFTTRVSYRLGFAGGGSLTLRLTAANGLQMDYSPFAAFAVSNTSAAFNTTDPITVVRTANSIVVRQGSASLSPSVALGAPGNLTSTTLNVGDGAAATVTVGPIEAVTFVDPSVTVTETSAQVTLSPADMWLIAPQSPGLSFRLAKSDASFAGVESQGSSVFESNTTVHRILGARLPVTTTSGPRQAEVTSLQVRTVSDEERRALLALVATDFPVLVNVPPSWGVGLTVGFFQIGDVSMSRIANIGRLQDRSFELPLTQVRAPIADVQNVGWSYAELATAFSSYSAVLSAFDSYADLFSNVRA